MQNHFVQTVPLGRLRQACRTHVRGVQTRNKTGKTGRMGKNMEDEEKEEEISKVEAAEKVDITRNTQSPEPTPVTCQLCHLWRQVFIPTHVDLTHYNRRCLTINSKRGSGLRKKKFISKS